MAEIREEKPLGLDVTLLQVRQLTGRGAVSSSWRATYDNKDIVLKAATRQSTPTSGTARAGSANAALEDKLSERMFLLDAQKTIQLSHRHIVRCFGVVQLPEGTSSSAPSGLAMALEAHEPYTLKDILTRSMAAGKRLYKIKQACGWLLQIASALEHLHVRKPAVIHRDLRPDNVLLKREADGELTCRLGELGLHWELPGEGPEDARPGGIGLKKLGAAIAASAGAAAGATGGSSPLPPSPRTPSGIQEKTFVVENPSFRHDDDDDSTHNGTRPKHGAAVESAALPQRPQDSTQGPYPDAAVAAAAAASPAAATAAGPSVHEGGREAGCPADTDGCGRAAAGSRSPRGPTVANKEGEPTSTMSAAAADSSARGCDRAGTCNEGDAGGNDRSNRGGDRSNRGGDRSNRGGDRSNRGGGGGGQAKGSAVAALSAAAAAAGLTADSVGWYRDSLATHSLRSDLTEEAPVWVPSPSADKASSPQAGGAAAPSAMFTMLLSDQPDTELDPEEALRHLRAVMGRLGVAELQPLSHAEVEGFFNAKNNSGAYMYMAPEALRKGAFNEKCDVFSFGVMAYELLAGEVLLISIFNTGRAAKLGVRSPRGYAALVADGYRPPRLTKLPDSAWSLIEACWHQDPVERPSMAAVVQELQRITSGELAEDGAGRAPAAASKDKDKDKDAAGQCVIS